jgi:hypothetical protein
MEIDIVVEDVASLPSSLTRKKPHKHDKIHSFVALNYSFMEKKK